MDVGPQRFSEPAIILAKFGQASQDTTWAGLFHFPRESAAGMLQSWP